MNFKFFLPFIWLLSALLSIEVLSQNKIICDDNEGNLKIKEVYRWYNRLILLKDNRQVLQIEYDWVNPDFQVKNVIEWPHSVLNSYDIFTPVFIPGEGNRLLALKKGRVHNITQLVGQVHEMKSDGEPNSIRPIQTLPIHPLNCVNSTNFRICRIFQKLPEDNVHELLTSMSSFPLNFGSLPQRMFVYYKEINTKQKVTPCPNDCYNSWRFLFIASNQTLDNKMEATVWDFDNSTTRQEYCYDLRDEVIIASTSLNDYSNTSSNTSLNDYEFDWIEFLDPIFYRIIRISIAKDGKFNKPQTISEGQIGQLFGCKQTSTVIRPTLPPLPPTTSEDSVSPGGTPSTASPGGTPSTASPGETPSTASPEETPSTVSPGETPSTPTEEQKPKPQSPTKKVLTTTPKPKAGIFPIILIVILLILIIAVVVFLIWFFVLRKSGKFSPSKTTPPPTQPQATAPNTESNLGPEVSTRSNLEDSGKPSTPPTQSAPAESAPAESTTPESTPAEASEPQSKPESDSSTSPTNSTKPNTGDNDVSEVTHL